MEEAAATEKVSQRGEDRKEERLHPTDATAPEQKRSIESICTTFLVGTTDDDPVYRYHRWKANLRVLEIEPIKSVPHTPASHPFVERLIGSVRREYLDQDLFWNSLDLERKLASFRDYYNDSRVHSSLGGKAPAQVSNECERPLADATNYRWQSRCGGLYALPEAA